MPTISQAFDSYLENVKLARSAHTFRAYSNAISAFSRILHDHNIDSYDDVNRIVEEAIAWMALDLKHYAPATEQLYLTAVAGFYEFLAAENLSQPNLPRVRMLIKQRGRRPGIRLPQFPREEIERIVDYFTNTPTPLTGDPQHKLRYLRDKAFIVCLADTGLRVHEAVSLRRGDIDWNEGKAVIIGKGDREAVIRFSSRSLNCLKSYLQARAELDGNFGKPLTSLPLFARHDRGAGKRVTRITTTTGRNIITDAVRSVLGEEAVGTITPHSFRHYFVTTVLLGSGGNLKLAQSLARHRNIQVTQRYAHLSDDELDKGYFEIFEK
jgi:integrase/recombinase XerC